MPEFPRGWKIINGLCYDQRTHIHMIAALEDARRTRMLVQIDYGDLDTGAAWAGSRVSGYVVASSAGRPVPALRIAGTEGSHGEAILDHCIVRLCQVLPDRRLRVHCRHSNFHVPVPEPTPAPVLEP